MVWTTEQDHGSVCMQPRAYRSRPEGIVNLDGAAKAKAC